MNNFPIIFEDEDILVIDKPAGIVVNEASNVPGETIQSWMSKRLYHEAQSGDWYSLLPKDFTEEYGSPEEIFKERNGIVHRLDKDTSGALVLAKNPGSLMNLMAQFKQRETHKEYICLVHGLFHSPEDTIRLPLLRSTSNKGKFQVSVGGRPAETAFKVLKTFAFSQDRLLQLIRQHDVEKGKTDAQVMKEYQTYHDFSLISCQPKTGRTHQIRVHFSYLQHPLVSDQVYTNKWRVKADVLWCPRQFLHASSITFKHPRTKEMLTLAAPLENDLEAVLKTLE
jgi:23S rRNA pseudouridine1911/1915/1917 synthase